MLRRIATVGLALGLLATGARARSEEGWNSLFDGKSLAGWTALDGKPVTGGWVAEDGLLVRKQQGGDIYTDREYANFVLDFEWRIAPDGNSGVKYRMAWYNGQYLGPEYQVFDDGDPARPKIADPRMQTASLYEILACNAKKRLKPAGEWNSGRIVANGKRIEHWLNGERVVEADTASEAFAAAVGKSKFAKRAKFGRSPSGRIMLQDHGSQVWYRNLRLKELPD